MYMYMYVHACIQCVGTTAQGLALIITAGPKMMYTYTCMCYMWFHSGIHVYMYI